MTIEALERRGKPENLHHIGPVVERAVQDIARRAEARNRPNPLWESVQAQFGHFPHDVVRAIYKFEKAAHKRNASVPERTENTAAIEVTKPFPDERVRAIRNSGVSGESNRVFMVVRPPRRA